MTRPAESFMRYTPGALGKDLAFSASFSRRSSMSQMHDCMLARAICDLKKGGKSLRDSGWRPARFQTFMGLGRNCERKHPDHVTAVIPPFEQPLSREGKQF